MEFKHPSATRRLWVSAFALAALSALALVILNAANTDCDQSAWFLRFEAAWFFAATAIFAAAGVFIWEAGMGPREGSREILADLAVAVVSGLAVLPPLFFLLLFMEFLSCGAWFG